jgi:hypothetical protein
MRISLNLRATVSMLAIALSVAAAAPLAHADDVTRRAKAEQLIQLTKTESVMEQQLGALRDRVNELATQQIGPGTQSPEQKTLTDAYLKQVHGVTEDEVGWTKLRPIIVQVYAESFTDSDLDGIIAFYKSPAGQAMIAKTPELSGKTMSLVQDRIKEMQPKLAQMTEDYQTKMKATAPAAAPAPAAGAPAKSAAPAAKPATPGK